MKWGALLLGCACTAHGGPELFEQAGRGLQAAKGRDAAVVLRCEPLDAEVFIDEVPVGTCGKVGEQLPVSGAGFKHLQVKKPGFQPWETWIDIGGARAVLTAELVAAP